MIPPFIDKTLLPHKPGVYIFKGSKNQVLYVGKAIDLFSRVSSYFSAQQNQPKTVALVSQIRNLETIIVESEVEALILEANLIKKYLPPFNIRLTDDKDFLYIKVTKEPFPRILTARRKELDDAKAFFGPFPSAATVRTTLKKLRRVFPWCASPPKPRVQGTGNRSQKPCFYHHLKLCPGPCAGAVDQHEYNQIIDRFIKFMQGKKSELTGELQKEMEQAAKDLDFEKAQRLKRTIDGITYLLQPNKTQVYLENPNFLESQNESALQALKDDLKLLNIPERIEGYDISNTQGNQATGSLVVLTHGEVDKSQYRRFKIIITGKPNDYAMMAEMLRRRLKHPEWLIPDLIIIDGGRGQVRAAREELIKANFNIPVFGLAKREEWLYPPEGEVVKLPRYSMGLRLLQKLRDEAHRFAITYHRKLRAQTLLK